MKIVSHDKDYIDYTTRKFGVRVRASACRAVVLEGNHWEEYGEEFRIPLDPSWIDRSRANCLNYDLAMNVLDYEEFAAGEGNGDRMELRALLLGVIDPNTAGLRWP